MKNVDKEKGSKSEIVCGRPKNVWNLVVDKANLKVPSFCTILIELKIGIDVFFNAVDITAIDKF